MFKLSHLAVLLTIAVTVYSQVDINPYRDCGYHDVTNVEIVGCPRAAQRCTLDRGGEKILNITYDSEYSVEKAQITLIAHVGKEEIDLSHEIPGFQRDGCKATTCPIKYGEEAVFSDTLKIGDRYPSGDFELQVLLIGDNNVIFCNVILCHMNDG
ncbi:unnamed protein product [Oppiella nova]|uniref:MD-2-related lipid-recognition domain-containing protein n=1 Tax=Oppiella nova TaxID=334625 RepID=A0A7R9QSX9_9ACAR|nr:unnamed protein product [Oppiella nova]CAG2174288.1 unnamed protein product [Oppiella nova]